MNINQQQTDNLYKAFALFIEAMRPYIVSLLMKQAKEDWAEEFTNCLLPAQLETWKIGIKSGTPPEALIDYPHLRSFALKYRDLLRPDFGRDTSKLVTRFDTIYEARNSLAHFREIKEELFTETFIHMKNIAHSLGMTELEEELMLLRENKTVYKGSKQAGSLQPWFLLVSPHSDIRQGRLDESVFAANLAEVAIGNGREMYNNPVVFFSKTYFTQGLKNIARRVVSGLNGNEDAENRVISLQTGFGGGKTHALISLFHLCKLGRGALKSAKAEELLQYTGVPNFEQANIAVFTNTTNDIANGRTTPEGIHLQTLWGELAYQLGGKEAYEIVRKNDEQCIAPAGLFKKVLEQCKPALILIDELADYCVKASAKITGNSSLADQTISFMQELTEAIAGSNHCVAVITLPASPQEVGNTPEAQSILNSLQKRVSRVGADTQPVADEEVFEVIRRRLFEDVGNRESIEAAAATYLQLYQQQWTELPTNANKTEYKQRILKSYPFHPELIDIFRVRWASHHDFQRTRGVLRLLAAIVSDLWKRQQSLPGNNLLIHSGQINLANLDALSGQLKRLYGNGYDAVISADVAGASSNAFKIDADKRDFGQWYLTQSVASVILMNSFGSDGANKGIGIAELKLHLLQPDSFNHNNINGALDALESRAYYLYYAQAGGAGKRYWFHTKPNINILINQAKADIKQADVELEVLRRIKEKTSNKIQHFNLISDPSEDIPEQQKLTLVILHPRYMTIGKTLTPNTQKFIERIATKKGNSDRIFRNTLLFLVCSEMGMHKLSSCITEYLACQKIITEYGSQLEKEQKEEVKRRIEDASKQADQALVVAYSAVVKISAKNGPEILQLNQHKDNIENQLNLTLYNALKEEEWLLDAIGYNTLRNNNLLPTPTQSIRVKDIYEAFLRYDDKPMITGPDAVAKSLQRYCSDGQFCIATAPYDDKQFTHFYLEETVPFFEVNDTTYWLTDKTLMPQPETGISEEDTQAGTETTLRQNTGNNETPKPQTQQVKTIKTLSVWGKIPLEQYTQVFNSFVMPLAQNNIEIEISIKGKSTLAKPLTENSPEYKIVKESAKQLGLNFSEEE